MLKYMYGVPIENKKLASFAVKPEVAICCNSPEKTPSIQYIK